jgi:hypothetical protein
MPILPSFLITQIQPKEKTEMKRKKKENKLSAHHTRTSGPEFSEVRPQGQFHTLHRGTSAEHSLLDSLVGKKNQKKG